MTGIYNENKRPIQSVN